MTEMAPSTLAQWVGGLGTIAAVVVALFKDPILAWKRKPRLKATCKKESPWTVRTPAVVSSKTTGQPLWGGESYYVRAKIENTGSTRAEKVQVSAQTLAKQGADKKFTDLETSLPFNLKWSNIGTPILDGISPKMSAFCDIVALFDPANPHQRRPVSTPPNATVGHLELEVEPFTDSHLLPPGTYRLSLRIAAANAEPIDKIIEFTHSGIWLEDDAEMRRECLGVSLI
jgi:hypothetical protein